MKVLRLFFIIVIVTMQQPLFSQVAIFNNSMDFNWGLKRPLASLNDFAFSNNRSFSSRCIDTLMSDTFKLNEMQNQIIPPKWIKGAIFPVALIMAGTITLLPESNSLLSKFKIHNEVLKLFAGAESGIDNSLQFAPLAAVFALKAAGVKSRSDLLNQGIITAKAELLMMVIVHGIMKSNIPSVRPNGGLNSMPSGHTAQAFVSATILDMEYRDASPWISLAGYAAATTTGLYRMINNKHWISDVLIGAGIGIFSTKVVYFTHHYRFGNKNKMVILPAIYKNGGGISFAMVL